MAPAKFAALERLDGRFDAFSVKSAKCNYLQLAATRVLMRPLKDPLAGRLDAFP
jgi:hypothetical protein